MSDKALIIFTRNPELGKCKTRLAKSIGDEEALKIYKHLLSHTAEIAKKVNTERFVFYSENILDNDLWDNNSFNKRLQNGKDLGERMQNAFETLFSEGFKKLIIVGSDLLDLSETIIENAFKKLDTNDAVIGPAEDGGYYLLGMNVLNKKVFESKKWGSETVFEETKKDFYGQSLYVLETLNDIDYLEDLKPYKNFNYLF
ncbi:MAG: glycosyltransferase [Winogradskyella sp.]|uniref:TIGR04282 family arsenosugar biosynthesis glycosyltransferase n=1 Tax=Winogradskyella sp. TaxID=1883156 RepID=UPI000F3E773C|nr:TIGR04282 family arsenosugar biosynthesis glycosyltransferase [Winogradskyella sp.]RNC84138.1 MAG: glycosyltransferase [Winogradskyella sp.]